MTGREITNMLIDKSILAIEKDQLGQHDRKALSAAHRSLRRWLLRHGYKRGKKKGTIKASPNNEAKRDYYLQKLTSNRNLPPEERKREVYLDESYIHQHYKWKPSEYVYDPNDDQDVQVSKMPNKGERYCFVCAIQEPSVAPKGLYTDNGGIVPHSLWAFSPTRKANHKGDYHKVFNGMNFNAWVRDQLLPNLDEPSLIIMDNAKYHCTFAEDVPKVYKLKKEELVHYLQSVNVRIDPSDTVAILKQKANKYVQENEQWEIVKLAEERGHKVLFTPAYHSDLQPIELVWARVKGNVGRQYDADTKLSDVYDRLIVEFD